MENMKTVAKPYAVAACEYAKEHNSVSKWYEDLVLLSEVISNPCTQVAVTDPSVSQEQVLNFILESFSDLDEGFTNFLHLLAEKDKLEVLPAVKDLFTEFRNIDLNRRVAIVTVASNIEESYIESLKKKLVKKFGFDLEIQVVIDKSILGGIIVQIDDMVIDDSIIARLSKMRNSLLS